MRRTAHTRKTGAKITPIATRCPSARNKMNIRHIARDTPPTPHRHPVMPALRHDAISSCFYRPATPYRPKQHIHTALLTRTTAWTAPRTDAEPQTPLSTGARHIRNGPSSLKGRTIFRQATINSSASSVRSKPAGVHMQGKRRELQDPREHNHSCGTAI